MAELVPILTTTLGEPVIDGTNLKETFVTSGLCSRAGHFRRHNVRLKETERAFAHLLEKPQTVQDHGTVLPPVA
jgi:hypothetical protein